MSPPESKDIELWRGSVNERLDRVIRDLEEERAASALHRQALRDVIAALSLSVNTVAENVRRMEPVVADYRDTALEVRGAAKLGKALWAVVLGLVATASALIIEIVRSFRALT